MEVNKEQFKAWGLLIILALIWGSSFILIKLGLKELYPDEVGALRIVAASIFLFPFAFFRIRRVHKKHIPLLVSVGLVGSLFPSFLFATAQTKIDSSAAGILNALTPLFTILIGFFFFKQKFSKATIVGLILGFIGTVLLIISGSKGDLSQLNFYALYVVLATVFYGVNLNLIKYKIPDLSSVTITGVSLMIVGPVAIAYLWFFTSFFNRLVIGDDTFLWSAGGVVLLGILGTAIALILFNQLVKLTQPIFASSVTYLIPIVAVIWGLAFNEVMRMADYFGLIAIISGVYLANTKRKKTIVVPKA